MNAEFYRCPICGNIVYLIEGNGSHLACCGKPMEKLVPGAVDAAKEKHVPDVKYSPQMPWRSGKAGEILDVRSHCQHCQSTVVWEMNRK